MYKNTFKKRERLSGKITVNRLFNSGKSFFLHPFLVYYRPVNNADKQCRVLITVSKRNYKKAVTRNLIKRRIRESYRLIKSGEQDALFSKKQYDIGLVYISKEVHSSKLIKTKLKIVLDKLSKADA